MEEERYKPTAADQFIDNFADDLGLSWTQLANVLGDLWLPLSKDVSDDLRNGKTPKLNTDAKYAAAIARLKEKRWLK